MVKRVPAEEIICPNCKGSVNLVADFYRCQKCNEDFQIYEGIHILLPEYMEQCKMNEDRIWHIRKDSLSLNKPAWKALVYKADMIKSFEENILRSNIFHGRVLELGGGCCWGSALVKTRFPETVAYATDISPIALQKGQEVSKIMEAGIDYFVACDAENIPFKDALFDAVFSVALLHHLPSTAQALNEIRRVLKPTGFYIGFGEILSSEIFRPVYRRISLAERRSKELGIIENAYTYDQWKSFLTRSGFNSFNINLHKDPKYRRNIFGTIYYTLIKKVPEIAIRNILFSTFWVFAER